MPKSSKLTWDLNKKVANELKTTQYSMIQCAFEYIFRYLTRDLYFSEKNNLVKIWFSDIKLEKIRIWICHVMIIVMCENDLYQSCSSTENRKSYFLFFTQMANPVYYEWYKWLTSWYHYNDRKLNFEKRCQLTGDHF